MARPAPSTPRAATPRRGPRSPRRKRARPGKTFRLARLWPSARTRRRWRGRLRRAPFAVQAAVGLTALIVIWMSVNWAYHVVRKPSELFFPVSHTLAKTPTETWRQYEPIFRQHATATVTPVLLAALAQVEASGNPIARTYWRWRPSLDPFEVYRPASSAVGMYQMTDGTFAEARRYCIRDHVVVEDGPWHDPGSCWFNALYTRVVPSHAVELTSAYLDRRIADILTRRGIRSATLAQKQDLAAVIHLCGAGAGDAFARRGFRLRSGQRCGDHDVAGYLARIDGMKRLFARRAAPLAD